LQIWEDYKLILVPKPRLIWHLWYHFTFKHIFLVWLDLGARKMALTATEHWNEDHVRTRLMPLTSSLTIAWQIILKATWGRAGLMYSTCTYQINKTLRREDKERRKITKDWSGKETDQKRKTMDWCMATGATGRNQTSYLDSDQVNTANDCRVILR